MHSGITVRREGGRELSQNSVQPMCLQCTAGSLQGGGERGKSEFCAANVQAVHSGITAGREGGRESKNCAANVQAMHSGITRGGERGREGGGIEVTHLDAYAMRAGQLLPTLAWQPGRGAHSGTSRNQEPSAKIRALLLAFVNPS